MAVQLSAVGAKMWLLHLQSSGRARGSLSSNVFREICSYFHDPLFTAIWWKMMELYDFHTRKITRHTLPVEVLRGYIQVDRTTVFIVWEEVLTLDLLTLRTTPLPVLLTPRKFVGVAQVGTTVFAFGGSVDSAPSTVCEKSSTLDCTRSHVLR